MTNPQKHVEYRVREIKRYTVTRFEYFSNDQCEMGASSSRQIGSEYPNEDTAYEVAYALCSVEHEQLGYPLTDPRIRYPTRPSEEACQKAETGLYQSVLSG